MTTDFLPLFTQAAVTAGQAQIEDRTHARILDAALADAAQHGVHGVTIERVARRARVNRVTVYRRFGDRNALLAALAAREGQQMALRLAHILSGIDDPEQMLVEGFTAAIREARAHPILERVARLEPQELLAAGMADDARLLRIGTMFVAEAIRQAQQQGRATHLPADLAGETLARIFASFVLIPAGQIPLADESAVRNYAKTTLVPMLLGR